MFAIVALSSAVLTACSSDDEYVIVESHTLAKGMMTRSGDDAGAYPDNGSDSVMTAVIEKETLQMKANSIETPMMFSVNFYIKANNPQRVDNTEVTYVNGIDYSEQDFIATVSNVNYESKTCDLHIKSKPNVIYEVISGEKKKVHFYIKKNNEKN